MNRLNGTSWGEIGDEVKIPAFMTPEWQEMDRKIVIAEEAIAAAAKGREHRRMYKKLRRKVDGTSLLIVCLTVLSLLAFMEWLLR